MAYISSHLKDMNRRLVYNLLLEKGTMSKADISHLTGISPPTVMKIIEYFKSIDFIQDVGEGDSALGRKPQLLRLKADAVYVLGIDFTGIVLKIGLVDLTGHICQITIERTKPDFDSVIRQGLAERIDCFLMQAGIPAQRLAGICVGLPGRVNTDRRTIDLAPLEGIMEQTNYRDIEETLSRRYQIPVIFENDANAAALGEFSYRRLAPDEDLLYIALGKGIGSGIMIHGELRRGSHFLAGEIGYMVFGREYTVDKQNAGWLEQALTPERLTEGKDVPEKYLDDFSVRLAMAIVNLCVPLEIHHIALGRVEDARLSERLVSAVRAYLKRFSVLDLECNLSACQEPVIEGCAHIALTPVLNRYLGETQ